MTDQFRQGAWIEIALSGHSLSYESSGAVLPTNRPFRRVAIF